MVWIFETKVCQPVSTFMYGYRFISISSSDFRHLQSFKERRTLVRFSDYPKEHDLFSLANKKVPGKFKDEMNSKAIKKFCGLRPKMYALVYEDNDKDVERKTAKGVARAVLRFHMYETTLFDRTEILTSMKFIRSHSHHIHCEIVRKKTLSAFDDKRYLLTDGISSLAYGHYIIRAEKKTYCLI